MRLSALQHMRWDFKEVPERPSPRVEREDQLAVRLSDVGCGDHRGSDNVTAGSVSSTTVHADALRLTVS